MTQTLSSYNQVKQQTLNEVIHAKHVIHVDCQIVLWYEKGFGMDC